MMYGNFAFCYLCPQTFEGRLDEFMDWIFKPYSSVV